MSLSHVQFHRYLFILLLGVVLHHITPTHGKSIRAVGGNNSNKTSDDDLLDVQSLILYKLPDDNVAAINKQINLEYSAFYAYESMAAFFDSANNPMPGCSKFLLKLADKQLNQARIFITFLNIKGGKLFLPDIKAPTIASWDSCLSAMQDALRIEIQIRYGLHDLSKRATKELDFAFEKLASDMIFKNAKSIKQIADIVRQFLRVAGGAEGRPTDRGAGEFLLDKELQKDETAFSASGLAKPLSF
ncbi:putative Soma ferritin [Hypsibius exemplaris]|uniref:Ferritin n=1 Tax=Hypsibius exemplaris TaxID=2072580 RepID=A0A1W0X3Q0_HYPEX|nr:putative Soma ferritin [Hypsibius exemplaris]